MYEICHDSAKHEHSVIAMTIARDTHDSHEIHSLLCSQQVLPNGVVDMSVAQLSRQQPRGVLCKV